MGREILQPSKAMTITMKSVAPGNGRISDQLDLTDEKCTRIRVYVRIKTGAVAPTAGEIVKFYAVRSDGDPVEPHFDDGLGAVDAAVGTEPGNSDLVGTLVFSTATANKQFYTSFTVDLPSDLVSIVVWNASATTTFGSSDSNHYMRWRASSLEA